MKQTGRTRHRSGFAMLLPIIGEGYSDMGTWGHDLDQGPLSKAAPRATPPVARADGSKLLRQNRWDTA